MKTELNFYQIWIMMEKSFVKLAPALLKGQILFFFNS